MHNTAFEEIHSNLSLAFDLIQDCGLTYRQANDATKRLLNQAIFKGFYIYNEDTIKAELAEPFDQILPPIMDDIARVNHAKSCNTNCLAEAVEKAKGHIQTIFGCGSSFGHNKSPYPNESNFFDSESLNKDFLVDDTRLEETKARFKPCFLVLRRAVFSGIPTLYGVDLYFHVLLSITRFREK